MLHTADSAIVQSALFGGAEGESFNDLVTLGWPSSKPINVNNPIAQIVVHSGWIIDAFDVTYNLSGGGTQTISHGNQAGGGTYTVDISPDEVIFSVVGKAGPHAYYNKDLVQQITFIIVNTQTSAVRMAGPYGNGDQSNQGTLFQASGVLGFAGVQTGGAGISGLSFIASKAWV